MKTPFEAAVLVIRTILFGLIIITATLLILDIVDRVLPKLLELYERI